MINCIFFDNDGVLVDTERLYDVSFRRFGGASHHLQPACDTDLHMMKGVPALDQPALTPGFRGFESEPSILRDGMVYHRHQRQSQT